MKRFLSLLVLFLVFTIIPVFAIQVISLQKTSFRSNDPDLNKDAWLVTFVINNLPDYLVGYTVDNKEFKTPDGGTAKYDLIFRAKHVQSYCSYPIYAREQPYEVDIARNIYLLRAEDYGTFVMGWGIDEARERCANNGGWYWVQTDRGFPNVGGICVFADRYARLGDFGTPVYSSKEYLELEVNGEKVSDYLDTTSPMNKDSVQKFDVWLGDRAKVDFVGYLPGGYFCPSPNRYLLAWIYPEKEWVLILKERYESWKQRWYELITYMGGGQTHYDDELMRLINETNLYARYAAYDVTHWAETPLEWRRAELSGKEERGQVVVPVSNKIGQMVVTAIIDAEWLGIYKPVGKPKILDVWAVKDKFSTGTENYINVYVKNVGDGAGSFIVSASCEAPLRMLKWDEITLSPGEQGLATVTITGYTAKAEETGDCKIIVYDRNNPANKDTREVSLKLTNELLRECNPGELKCSGRVVLQCNSDGYWEKLKVCPEGYYCDLKTPGYCSKIPEGGVPTPHLPAPPAPTIPWEMFIPIIIALVAAIIFLIILIKKL